MTYEEACEILEIDKNSDMATIKVSYRKVIKKYHPDLGGSNYMTKKINEAYNYLTANYNSYNHSNSSDNNKYKNTNTNTNTNNNSHDDFDDKNFEDIFNEYFNDFFNNMNEDCVDENDEEFESAKSKRIFETEFDYPTSFGFNEISLEEAYNSNYINNTFMTNNKYSCLYTGLKGSKYVYTKARVNLITIPINIDVEDTISALLRATTHTRSIKKIHLDFLRSLNFIRLINIDDPITVTDYITNSDIEIKYGLRIGLGTDAVTITTTNLFRVEKEVCCEKDGIYTLIGNINLIDENLIICTNMYIYVYKLGFKLKYTQCRKVKDYNFLKKIDSNTVELKIPIKTLPKDGMCMVDFDEKDCWIESLVPANFKYNTVYTDTVKNKGKVFDKISNFLVQYITMEEYQDIMSK